MKQSGRIDVSSTPVWTESWGSPFQEDHSRPDFESSGVSTPAVNVIETREDLRIEMVAPGMKKEAFAITVHDSVLTISYDHGDNLQAERSDWKYRIREFNYHSFMRSFQLPDIIETDRVAASYADGILLLRIPKKKEAIARQIAVL